MKFITTILFVGALTVIGGNAVAAPSDLDLGFKLIHSAEFDAYSQSSEAKGLTLKGIEWAEAGADLRGELVVYKLTFLKMGPGKSGEGVFHICNHAAKAYFTRNADGTHAFAGADFENMDLECN